VLASEVSTVALDRSLVSAKSGFAFAKSRLAESGTPHLRPFNIGSNGELELETLYYLPDNHGKDLSQHALIPGDVLFNNTSSLEIVGKSALVRESFNWSFSNHVTRLRVVDRAKLRPGWLHLCIRSLWLSGHFRRNATRWIGQAGFSATKLRRISISLPDPEEQDRLVEQYEASTADSSAALRLLEESVKEVRQFDSALLLAMVPPADQAG
jgi:type I restriction enzyme S subunit